MINDLTADQKAALVNSAMFFEMNGYENLEWELFKSCHQNSDADFKKLVLDFLKNTSRCTQRLYLAFCLNSLTDNENFKAEIQKKNPVINFTEWVIAWAIVLGGGFLIAEAIRFWFAIIFGVFG